MDVTFYDERGEEIDTGTELYIDIPERGVSVQIVASGDGFTVNVWPMQVADSPLGSINLPAFPELEPA
jgi:hypothetical protein